MNGQFKVKKDDKKINKKMKMELKEEKPGLIFEIMKLKIGNESLFVEKGFGRKLKEMFEFFDEIKETFNVSSKERASAILLCLENIVEAFAYQIIFFLRTAYMVMVRGSKH